MNDHPGRMKAPPVSCIACFCSAVPGHDLLLHPFIIRAYWLVFYAGILYFVPFYIIYVDERLEALDCPPKAQMQIDVAIDELFGNIAHYAYEHGTGPATVRVDVEQQPLAVRITFIDHGKPYDPLAKEDPDVTLSAEERQIGGLGIFMVKKTMDDVKYEYRDGQNILTDKKRLDT